MSYHPSWRGITFHDVVPEGAVTARAYLEHCLERIAEREPVVRAFTAMNVEDARTAADASTARWKAGQPLSPIDGMPIAIKDLIETRDMPTQMGSAAYEGNFPKREGASVRALREAGAIILAKAVTTELGQSEPGPTTNPWNPAHTPGGSSSGSAAAVAAGFVPVAIGTQVGGSIIRPAAYCGNWALKPTQGGIHRGERQGTSQSTAGPHANCAEDAWAVAREISRRAGGDPGHPGIQGPLTAPEPQRPMRIGVMRTEIWDRMPAAAREAFERLVRSFVPEVLWPEDHPLLKALEKSGSNANAVGGLITSFENRAGLLNLPREKLGARTVARLDASMAYTAQDYHAALVERHAMRAAQAALAPVVDMLIAPSCPGPAPVWDPAAPDAAQNSRPTGDASCNAGTSALGAPAVTMPMLAVGGLPMGVQVVCQPNEDARAIAYARWLYANTPGAHRPG
jgi:Asp-tRNA(Asn)/Glu-tRNA(Gln) amidotransferase A subunit family amidase